MWLEPPQPYYGASVLNRDLALGVQTADGQWGNVLLELNIAFSLVYALILVKAVILKSNTDHPVEVRCFW